MSMFVGLGHYSRTGKDSFANAYVQYVNDFYPEVGARRVSFATALKKVAHDLYGWAGLRDEAYYNSPAGERHRDTPLSRLGGLTPVDVWCRLGTDAIRNQVWADTWVDLVLESSYSEGIIIIPDVRFPNEVDALRRKSGYLYKITRPGFRPRNTVADQALVGYNGWDEEFNGGGVLDNLLAKARAVAETHAQHMKDVGFKKKQTVRSPAIVHVEYIDQVKEQKYGA